MKRHERSVYEPDDQIRVFDGSDDEEDAEGSRLPLLIVLALLVLAMFAGVVWLAYTQGVARGRTEAPVLTADAVSAKAKSPGAGFKIYEQPAPADDESDAAPAPASTPATVSQSSVPAPASAPPQHQATATLAAPMAIRPSLPPASAPAASKPAAPVAAAPPVSRTASVAKLGPATAPPKRLGSLALAAPAVLPARVAAAATASAPAPAPVVADAYALQIGAYKSPEDASAAWATYKAKHAALLAGYAQDVQRADLGDKGVWYRLRIAGFPGKDVAEAMCDRLKADGGSCFLAR